MVIAVGINADQGFVLATVRQTSHDIRSDQFYAMVPYNVPAKNVASAQASFSITYRAIAPIQTTQAFTLAVVKGRIATPRIRAFTFTLDGHDFYGLRLGDMSTLLYDVSSQQWIEWTSQDAPFWRVNTAVNWIGAQALGNSYGSDVVAGDDTWGLLYFLNPDQPYDIHPDYLNLTQQLPYPRIAMAQATVSGRNFVPCYAIFLDTDVYGFATTDFIPSVTLETSDDQGVTFQSHGTITAQPDTDSNDYRWYSLGQMQSPGRLFRVTDNGLLTRIDAMSMNDDG